MLRFCFPILICRIKKTQKHNVFTPFNQQHVEQRFSNFLELRTTFLSQNSSQTTLLLFPSKANIIFVEYFNTSILMICNLARSIIGVRLTVLEHFSVQTGYRQNY